MSGILYITLCNNMGKCMVSNFYFLGTPHVSSMILYSTIGIKFTV